MPDDDAELIGGISVSIGASHARLVADLAEADRLLETWARRQVNIAIGASFAGGQSTRAPRSGGAPAVRYGAAATTGVQTQQGQSALATAINAQLAKTGERYDPATGEIGKAETELAAPIEGQRQAIVPETPEANPDLAATQAGLDGVLATLRQIATAAASLTSLPGAPAAAGARAVPGAARPESAAVPAGALPAVPEGERVEAPAGAPGLPGQATVAAIHTERPRAQAPAAAAGAGLTVHERTVHTDLATRIAEAATPRFAAPLAAAPAEGPRSPEARGPERPVPVTPQSAARVDTQASLTAHDRAANADLAARIAKASQRPSDAAAREAAAAAALPGAPVTRTVPVGTPATPAEARETPAIPVVPPAVRITATTGSASAHERAINTDLATRIARTPSTPTVEAAEARVVEAVSEPAATVAPLRPQVAPVGARTAPIVRSVPSAAHVDAAAVPVTVPAEEAAEPVRPAAGPAAVPVASLDTAPAQAQLAAFVAALRDAVAGLASVPPPAVRPGLGVPAAAGGAVAEPTANAPRVAAEALATGPVAAAGPAAIVPVGSAPEAAAPAVPAPTAASLPATARPAPTVAIPATQPPAVTTPTTRVTPASAPASPRYRNAPAPVVPAHVAALVAAPRYRNAPAPAGEPRLPEYGADFPAIAFVDQLETQRRRSREVRGAGPIEVNRSEHLLNRQRVHEEAATARAQERQAAATARASAANQRTVDAAALQALSAEAEATAAGDNGPGTATFAPQRAQADLPAFRAEQERREAQAAQRSHARPATPVAAAPPVVDRVEAERERQLAALNARVRSGRAGGASEEDILRREEQRVATAESSRIAAGRTPRTTAAGFGGQFLFGGPARQQAEAVARQAAAEQNLSRVRRVLASPEVIRDARAYRAATEEQTVAETELADATKGVRDLSGPGTAVRSLAAVTAAGAAFSLGMKAVDFGLAVVGKGFANAFDIATGFGAETTRVTAALAQQTLALHGNSTEAIANAEAQAGISTTAARTLGPGLGLTTQVKAGAVAATSQQDLVRAALGAGTGAPQGLLGGYGGVLNSPLFAQQLGGGKGFAETIKDTFGDIGAATQQALDQGNPHFGGRGGAFGPPPPVPKTALDEVARLAKDRVALETSLNDAAKRGAVALGQLAPEVVHFGAITVDQAAKIAASNLPQELKDLASQSHEAIFDATGSLVTGAKDATKALEQVAVGQGIAPVDQIARANLAAEQQRQREAAASLDTIRSQQAYVLPSQIAAIGRQLGTAVGTQLPVQQTLAGLANPNVPVGTGIALNPGEGARGSAVAGSLKDAQALQDQLNAKYTAGQQIIRDTYDPAILKNFGQAALTDFDQSLAAVVATGKEIASVSAGISNEQAAYQTAQYNFQLVIAKRNLSDIGGLINENLGAGESYYGQLERQNLLLSRQAQLLQFALSQRQINFQVAEAGFVVPGVTPEERQANIKEAQIEASYAQKQLDLSKQQFKNQIKLIDIANIRQGRDLLRQIGLLQQGRAVTIDTAAAEAKLLRLNQTQQQEVAKVGQYLTAVDNVISVGMANIQQLEAAAGKAMAGIATDVLSQFGIFIKGLDDYVASIPGGTAGSGTGSGSGVTTNPSGTGQVAAGGAVGWLSGPTQIGTNGLAGEAGGETLLILSHPRAAGGGGGGNTFIVNINDPVVRDTNDVNEIARKVMAVMGKQSSLLGLRSPIS